MSQYRCRACVFPVDCTDPPGYIQIIVRTERQTPPAFLNQVLRIASSVPYLILIDIAYSRIGGSSKIDPLFLPPQPTPERSEEHTSELQYLMRTSYADFCLQQKMMRSREMCQKRQ